MDSTAVNSAVIRPLPGEGLVARTGDFLLVCAEAAETDQLLGVLADVAATGGDGSTFVRRVAALVAGDLDGRFPDCAISGPAANGGLAVLVYGAATASIKVADGDVVLSGADAITSVTRMVAGPVTAIRLQLPGAGVANPRSRLDSGVVVAAGVVLATEKRAMPEAQRPMVAAEPSRPASATEPPPAAAVAEPQAAVEPPAPPMPQAPAEAELPPTPDVPQVEVPQPQVEVPQPQVEVPQVEVPPAPGPHTPAEPPPIEPTPAGTMVHGVACPNNHFIDPAAAQCPVCGASMAHQTLVIREGPRPALGVLVVDDGSVLPLDIDYVVGREPHTDPDVVAGSARSLRIVDAEGVVSRRHARVNLVGWDVHVVDLGSANGTFVDTPEDAQRRQLVANQPLLVRPGTLITLGRRWIRFETTGNPPTR